MICHQIRLRGDDSFSYWLKAQDIFCLRMWAWISHVKQQGCVMGWHKLALKQIYQETFY